MTTALVRIQPKFRPYSGEIIGFRLQAAIPNKAARRMKMTSKGIRATSEEVPAFRKPYLIEESGDYASPALVSEADVERFAKQLNWAGYDTFEPVRGEVVDPLKDRIYDDFAILSK